MTPSRWPVVWVESQAHFRAATEVRTLDTGHPYRMPRLLIVDDHPSFRAFARTLFSGDEFDVAGEAGDGESALDAVEDLHPDVVLLDVNLPGIDGFEVARQLAQRADAPTVVLTSSREASDYGSLLVESPARGFIPKGELSADALAALASSA
jgi:DNA-binding NarL/FixJ family response regulator